MLRSTSKAIRDLLDEQRVLSLAVIVDGLPCAGLLHEQYAPGKDALQIKRATFDCAVSTSADSGAPWTSSPTTCRRSRR
jgi:hypothetical protein